MYTTAPHAQAFAQQGWQVIRGVFTPDEVADLRARCRSLTQAGRQAAFLLATPELRHLVTEPRLLALARTLLGAQPTDTLVALGEDNILRGARPDFPTTFHKDNADRINGHAPDWTQPYPILRFGLYLQDYTQHSGGLALYEGSHRRDVSVAGGRVHVHRGRRVFVQNQPGDVAAWFFTTSHRGNALRFRAPVLNALPPALALRLHRFPQLFWPVEPERWGIFLSYALEGPALERHLRYLATRAYTVQSVQAGQVEPGYLASLQLPPHTRVEDLPSRFAHLRLDQVNRAHVELPD